MAKEGKKALVPNLRFPEFRDPWNKKALAPYLEECGSRVPATTSLPIYSSSRSGLTPQASYYDGRTIINDGEYGVVPPNCFVYRHMSDDGQFAFNVNETGGEIAVSKEYPVFRTINLDSRFLRATLNHSQHFKAFALSQKAGGTRTRLYFSKLRSWETYLPSLAEQQKIADCLSSLDELIAAQGRKVEALKTYKRGLMQQLFPREGETLPRLRFPEFRDAPEWESRALGPMTSKVGSGVTPLGGDKNYKTQGRPFVRSQNVGWGELLLSDVAFIDEDTHRSFDATEIQESDVLLNITGASIGRSTVADLRIVGGNVNQHVCIIRVSGNELNPVYLNQFLISERGQKQIDGFQAGGNRQGLNFAQIRSFEVPTPPTVQEQLEVADCLSSLDAQIVVESRKLETFKIHKKGLMQQLFPSLEAVEA